MQKFQLVGGVANARLFGHRQDLVAQRVAAQIVQALTGHRAAGELRLDRHEAEHRVRQRTLARRAGALNDQTKRTLEQAAGRRQVPDQLTGPLADQSARFEVRADAVEQPLAPEQLQRGVAFGVAQFDRLGFRAAGGLLLLLLKLFERQQHAAQIAAQRMLRERRLLAGLFEIGAAGPGVVEVERVDMEAIVAFVEDEQVDSHHAAHAVAIQPPHPPPPRLGPERDFGFAVRDLEVGDRLGSRRSGGPRRRLRSVLRRNRLMWVGGGLILGCCWLFRRRDRPFPLCGRLTS